MAARTTLRKLEAWDKKYLWHPFTQHFVWEKDPTIIVRSGKGPYFKDIRGRKFLDGVSSLWVNLHGHNHPRLNRAFKTQLNKIAHSTFLGLSHEPAINLGRELARTLRKGLSRTFFSDNGATSIEVALKMSFQFWLETEGKPRPEFLAVKGSYHGDTIGSVSVGGIGAFHSKFKPLLFRTNFAMQPSCVGCPFNKKGLTHRSRLGEKAAVVARPGQKRPETGCTNECLTDVDRIFKGKKERIAAAVIEPIVQGATGMNVMPTGYLAGFARLAKKHGVLLIVDEVATGFGRTGTLFAFEQENVRPDFVCLAKALTAGYSPLAATVTTERVFNAFYGPISEGRTFFHGHSYTAHPLGAAVALENLSLIRQSKLVEKVRHKAHILREELRLLEPLPSVKSVRQAGLMAGVELSKAGLAKRVCKKLLEHGIWLRPLGDTLVVMPPPVVSDRDLRWLIRSMKAVINHEGVLS